MSTIFMGSEDSKTSDAHMIGLNLTYKIDLQKGNNHVELSTLSIYYTRKNIDCKNVKP